MHTPTMIKNKNPKNKKEIKQSKQVKRMKKIKLTELKRRNNLEVSYYSGM